jgi:hypothetical protein
MATWIVHLRLTENLLELIEGPDAAQFAVGNIAPDSGVPDEKLELPANAGLHKSSNLSLYL